MHIELETWIKMNSTISIPEELIIKNVTFTYGEYNYIYKVK